MLISIKMVLINEIHFNIEIQLKLFVLFLFVAAADACLQHIEHWFAQ